MTQELYSNMKGILNITPLYSIMLTFPGDSILKLLEILGPLEPLKRHQDVKLPRTRNAGTWLFRLEAFIEWRGSDTSGRAFCCYGIPGAGKTVIWY